MLCDLAGLVGNTTVATSTTKVQQEHADVILLAFKVLWLPPNNGVGVYRLRILPVYSPFVEYREVRLGKMNRFQSAWNGSPYRKISDDFRELANRVTPSAKELPVGA